MATRSDTSPACFRFGDDFVLDTRAYYLRSGALTLKLKPASMELLILLIEHRGELVTREQMVERIWGKGIFLDTDNSINVAISKIRQVLRDDPERPRFVLTVPGKGYRFIASVEEVTPLTTLDLQQDTTSGAVGRAELRGGARYSRKKSWTVAVLVLAAGLVAMLAGGLYVRSRRVTGLTKLDTILISDFTNKTGDPIFDETLRQALSIELSQSPFLRVASDLQIAETLRRMGRSPRDPLTRETAAEVCLRMGGKAFFVGTISAMGSRYILGLEALGCSTGERLAAAQAQAENKEGVLGTLGEVASQVRIRVGESLPSLENYAFPVNATTKSLEALKAFSMGLKAEREVGPIDAITFYQQAIQLDPDFSLAYATLARAYEDFGEDQEAVRNYTKAFEFRDRLSERERYFILTLYYETVTGELEKAKEAGELWTATYPKDGYAREKLGTVYSDLGELEKAYDQFLEALRLDPESEVNVYNAGGFSQSVGLLSASEHILQTALADGLDGEAVHMAWYGLAFQQRDTAEMKRQVAWATGKPGIEEVLVEEDSEAQAYFGRIHKARELSERAIESATRDKLIEMAANYQVVAALREIEIGEVSSSARHVRLALAVRPTRGVKVQAALALARGGNVGRARTLLKEVRDQNPADTLVNSYWAPAVEASLANRSGNPQVAVSKLQTATPYELSMAPPIGDEVFMYPTYIRGQAYLAENNGRAAIVEFKKVLDHPGVMLTCILGALARLQLARAEVLTGDRNAALRDYQAFLALWKDADPDVSIFKQARAEYKKLQ
jgi:DNA-binding winged helix-turn-helix (wHTH) protein/Tfp pilus assembly protein PilF